MPIHTDLSFKVYREVSGFLPLRKVCLEVWATYLTNEGKQEHIVDRRLMFGIIGGAFFQRRLARKKARMVKYAQMLLEHWGTV